MKTLSIIRQNFKDSVSFFDKINIAVLFFIWGILTQLTDLVVPLLYKFGLNFQQALMLHFTFFATYFIIALPAGKVVDKAGYKKGILIGLGLAALGCIIFYLAAVAESYQGFISALVIIAAGVTLLQISGNGYVVLQSNPAHDASNLTFAQSFNSLGRIITLVMGTYIFFTLSDINPEQLLTMSPDDYKRAQANLIKTPYLCMFGLIVLSGIAFYMSKLPEFNTKNLPVLVKKTQGTYGNVFEIKHLILGAMAIFTYVGAEVSIGSYLVQYISLPGMGYNQLTESKLYELLLYYWGSSFIGRVIGGFILRDVSPSRVVSGFALSAAVCVLVSIMTMGKISVLTILAVGFFNSILFPSIFSLAIKGLGHYSEEGASVLIASIVGGAILPLIVISASQWLGLKISFIIPVLCYLYVVYYGWWGSRYEAVDSK
ncbi:MAG: sugar MFS transporter [Cytophagales bacterium]|nr:sugar MFS transporter [Cytophagales bacterium]